MDKRELDRQISEYEDGKLNRTNARDLAALYIIRDYLYPESPVTAIAGTSFASPPVTEEYIGNYGNSEFFQAIAGKDAGTVWKVMGELMDTLQMVNERAYNGVMRKLV